MTVRHRDSQRGLPRSQDHLQRELKWLAHELCQHGYNAQVDVEACAVLVRGAAILDRAFTGFTALPAPEQWFSILGVPASSSKADIESAYKRLAMEHHPDRGGDSNTMARINTARDDGLAQMRNGTL